MLEALAWYKYDEYQQFVPGMRFIESLAYWLAQFREPSQRRTAYEFFKSKLIFCSTAEMNHFVSTAYPDHIRPLLLARAAREHGLKRWHLGRVGDTAEFKVIERKALFLGLSDGARTDVFRRANPQLSHEQVRQSHELSDKRVDKLLQKLLSGLGGITGSSPDQGSCRFNTVVLLDDFSGSGLSYVRQDGNGSWDGKIGTFLTAMLSPQNELSRLVAIPDVEVVVVLYMATDYARRNIEERVAAICSPAQVNARVVVICPLHDSVRISAGQFPALDAIITDYYDTANETDSTRLGGTDLRYGFNGNGLPLVLSHNTPNNSIGLLWAEGTVMRPLFPRVSRHKDRV